MRTDGDEQPSATIRFGCPAQASHELTCCVRGSFRRCLDRQAIDLRTQRTFKSSHRVDHGGLEFGPPVLIAVPANLETLADSARALLFERLPIERTAIRRFD